MMEDTKHYKDVNATTAKVKKTGIKAVLNEHTFQP